MAEALVWSVPLLGGALLGLLHFGGLWATVRRLPAARRPGLLVAASFVTRVALALAGFVLLTAGDARRAVVALAGFVAVRALVVRRGRSAAVEVGDADHA